MHINYIIFLKYFHNQYNCMFKVGTWGQSSKQWMNNIFFIREKLLYANNIWHEYLIDCTVSSNCQLVGHVKMRKRNTEITDLITFHLQHFLNWGALTSLGGICETTVLTSVHVLDSKYSLLNDWTGDELICICWCIVNLVFTESNVIWHSPKCHHHLCLLWKLTADNLGCLY